jgi:hypothetical protein
LECAELWVFVCSNGYGLLLFTKVVTGLLLFTKVVTGLLLFTKVVTGLLLLTKVVTGLLLTKCESSLSFPKSYT